MTRLCSLLLVVLGAVTLPAAAAARPPSCSPDSVRVGTVCVDKYEASVWRIPAASAALIKRVKLGKISRAELVAAGATQLCQVPLGDDTCASCTYGPTFPENGNWTAPVYAVSLAGVLPSSCLTWFQAEQACRLSEKRLVTNQEWQAAAAGTPDPDAADDGATTCDTNSDAPALSGARSACVSAWGAHDMVGNVWEWVGNWTDLATGTSCAAWDASYGGDITCVGPNAAESPPASTVARATIEGGTVKVPRDIFPLSPQFPGALIRGGNFAAGARNGVFAIYAGAPPHNVSRSTGFRCAR